MTSTPVTPADSPPADRDARPGTVEKRASSHGRTVVIVNPASGGAIDDDDLRAAFAGREVECSPTSEDEPGDGLASAATKAGAHTVVACGGDGTVRAVLEGVAGSDTALGIVPLGTGNLLAANLGLAEGLDAVVDALDGPLRRLDTASVNGERFAVMAGIGFDALMIRDANPTVKRRFGSVAYFLSAARNLPTRLVSGSLEVDGRLAWSGRTAMVLVGNCGSVTGGLEVFPDARPDDGVLDVAVLSAKGITQWGSVLWHLLRGTSQRPELVTRFRGKRIEVKLRSPMPFELDGEDRPATRTLHFEVDPSSLSVHTRHEEARG